MKGGIVIDSYKLPVFERRLTEAGYAFEKQNGIVIDTVLLTVHFEIEDTEKVSSLIKDANFEAFKEVPNGTC